MPETIDVEVFRAGDYGAKGAWDEDRLDDLARDYDPAVHEAPVTLDHAQQGPALGWVASVRRVGDRLLARLRGVSDRLLEMIRAGAFKKRSVEIYPSLRETGRPYLKAVSFLGAATPEVKGLADPLPSDGPSAPLFAEGPATETAPDAAAIHFDMTEPATPTEPADETHETHRTYESHSSTPSTSSTSSTSSTPPSPPSFLAFDDLADRLRQTGRWRPSWAERGIAEFFRALAAIDEIDVGEGQCVNAAEWFAEFLETLPPAVAFGEAAPAVDPASEPEIPRGGNVDPASVLLHRAAVAFRQSHPGVDYAEALSRCASRH